jgi:hypothetical protein
MTCLVEPFPTGQDLCSKHQHVIPYSHKRCAGTFDKPGLGGFLRLVFLFAFLVTNSSTKHQHIPPIVPRYASQPGCHAACQRACISSLPKYWLAGGYKGKRSTYSLPRRFIRFRYTFPWRDIPDHGFSEIVHDRHHDTSNESMLFFSYHIISLKTHVGTSRVVSLVHRANTDIRCI